MSRGGLSKKFRPSIQQNKKLEHHQSCTSWVKTSTLKGSSKFPTGHKFTLHIPKSPKGLQKPGPMACKHETKPAEVRNPVAHAANPDPDSQPLDCTAIRFDDQGMVLPHSILGSLDDFRIYLEAKGDTELVKRIQKSQRDALPEVPGRHHSEAVENRGGLCSGFRNTQSNALQHWQTHMTQRRRQQDFLSDLLHVPVENLLMNQADHFRETQEQREFINRVMPLIHYGYGSRKGSEFWSLPQRYGDEMSGIAATLTQTEQGRQEPVTRVGKPRSIDQESGITCPETLRPASRTWDQSVYLQERRQELRQVLQDMDIKKLEIDGLEVIGSGVPYAFVTVCCSPLREEEDEEREHEEIQKNSLDPPAQCEELQTSALLIPALRFCGQLASWTGNSTTNQGEVGISATILFEAPTGGTASFHLELHNEGSTAIFYSWQQLFMPRSFCNLRSQTKSPCFYFNSSSAVILPGITQQIEFTFKSEEPGIKTELWQLNTHPVLLQGASVQLTLRGVALHQDKTADQRLFIERKLEKAAVAKLCRSIVYEVLQGVHTPEKPRSPAELPTTEEQEFLRKNPKMQYFHRPVEDLKRLWQEVNPGRSWDLSVDTLRQVVLSQKEPTQLPHLNSLVVALSNPSEQKNHLTAAATGYPAWRKLLDRMVVEAGQLRNLLGLPESHTWIDKQEEAQMSDADTADNKEKREIKSGAAVGEERGGARSRYKHDNKVEGSRNKGKKRDEGGKRTRETTGQESVSPTDARPESVSQHPPDDQKAEQVMDIYTRLMHQKVYVLVEELVDSLCDMMDELNEGDEQET